MKLLSVPLEAPAGSAVRRQLPRTGAELPAAVRDNGSFKAAFATVTAPGTDTHNPARAAQLAELVHLELIRSGLTGDSRPQESAGTAALPSLLALEDVVSQKDDTAAAPLTEENSVIPAPSAAGGTAPAPALQPPPSLASLVARAARRYGVEEALITAVIRTESSFRPEAVSPAGAKGLMQLMPATCSDLGVSDPFDPEQNIMAGTRFLKNLLTRYGGDRDKALAAYNWGPGNLDRSRGRLPAETRTYLTKIRNLLTVQQQS